MDNYGGYSDIYKGPVEATFTQYPVVRGYFCAGHMKVAWYMRPNWLMRLIARLAGWRWEPSLSGDEERK